MKAELERKFRFCFATGVSLSEYDAMTVEETNVAIEVWEQMNKD